MKAMRSTRARVSVALTAAIGAALCVPAAAAAAAAPAVPSHDSISLSGTVTNARAERVSHGVISMPRPRPRCEARASR